MKQFGYILNFARKKKQVDLLIFLLALTITILVVFTCNDSIDEWFGKWTDPITALATLIIAIYIWLVQLKQDWLLSLPKRLNVHFTYEGKYVMSCYETWLAGESDIRAWGQQIGGQMSEFKNQLSFFPYLSSTAPKITTCLLEKDKDGKPLRAQLYEVTFYLRKWDWPEDNPLRTQFVAWIGNEDKKKGITIAWYDHQPEQCPTVAEAYNQSQKSTRQTQAE